MLPACLLLPPAQVLYLYDNRIAVIENLGSLRRLTHLYLSNNAISTMSGLSTLRSLQKLYLENNCIEVVEREPTRHLEPAHHRPRAPPHSSDRFKSSP
jgi:hypothetical protein